VFPIGFDSTVAPFALQLSAPAGMDGFLMGLGLALEKLFGPMPAPPTTAACSGCSSNVFYTNVSLTQPCVGPECNRKEKEKFTLFSDNGSILRRQPEAAECSSLHSQCTYPKPLLLSFCMDSGMFHTLWP